jgi:hypothetical protein
MKVLLPVTGAVKSVVAIAGHPARIAAGCKRASANGSAASGPLGTGTPQAG